MRRVIVGAAAAALLVAGVAASAVTRGGTLYIRARDTRIFEQADLKSKMSPITLQPGQEVTWDGPAEGNKTLHGISGKTKAGKPFKGFTLQMNLSPNKPAEEYLAKDSGKPIDPQAFASSGAATKALSEAALKYAEYQKKQSMTDLTKGVMTSEAVAKEVRKDDAVAYTLARTGGGQ